MPPTACAISVYQPRPDIPKNRIAIEVHNDGTEPVTITAATLSSSFFADDFVWGPSRTATVAPGYAVDLRVDIPVDAVCDDDRPRAHRDLRLDGRRPTGISAVDARRRVPHARPAARRGVPRRQRRRRSRCSPPCR